MAEAKQVEAFKAAAVKLGCDDDPEAFDKMLNKTASAPPPKSVRKRKAKRPAK